MSDLDKLFSNSAFQETEFDYQGIKGKVKYKEVGWSIKNKILGECFDYKSTGNAKFDFDKYNKLMLKEMILEISYGDSVVPQSELTEVFFTRLKSSVGAQLEKIIPKAFDDKGTDFFAKESSS